MSEAENTEQNLPSTPPRMKDGEEPTELLLALVSSPLLELQNRGLAKVLTAKGPDGSDVVLAIFTGMIFDQSVGISLLPTVVPTEAS